VFGVVNAPTANAFVDKLVSAGIMCFCTVSQPKEFYIQRASTQEDLIARAVRSPGRRCWTPSSDGVSGGGRCMASRSG